MRFTNENMPTLALVSVEMIRIPQPHHLCGGYAPVGGYFSRGHRYEGCSLDSLDRRCW